VRHVRVALLIKCTKFTNSTLVDEKQAQLFEMKRRRSLLGSLREKQLGQPRQRRIYPPLCSPS